MNFQFNNFNEFLAMGGHGTFVWACYGLVGFFVLFGIWYVRYERQKFIKQFKLQQARQAARQQPTNHS